MKVPDPPRGLWRIVMGSGEHRDFTNHEQFEAGVWQIVSNQEEVDFVEFNGARWSERFLQIVVNDIAHEVDGGEP